MLRLMVLIRRGNYANYLVLVVPVMALCYVGLCIGLILAYVGRCLIEFNFWVISAAVARAHKGESSCQARSVRPLKSLSKV